MDIREQALEKAKADHLQLSELIAKVKESVDLRRLAPLMEELQVRLSEHFEFEECDDGLFESVTDKAPRLRVRVDACRDEHTALLATAVDLRQRAQECLAVKGEILAETKGFLARLRAHEAEEARLLSDAVYTDLGVGD